jgi:GR25 family glycosyltransferase involved in LPS biosynthesis
MRILFLITGNGSRSNFVNGELMRYGEAGLSGTDTSAILVAEYLATQGYEIVLAVEKSDDNLINQRKERGFTFTPGDVIRGVTYTYLDLEGIENKTFEILVNCLWYGEYDNLPATITKAVCYWCHLAWMYYLRELKDYAIKHNLKVGYINISEWAKGHHQENINFLKEHLSDVEVVTLPNAMTIDVMQEILDLKLERKSKKVIFPAQWSRGGNVALRAVQELGWEADFLSFDYVNLSKGIDKKTLFTELATSDYFIFPQFTPTENVYKDVHSCAVGEAIGMGVVVVSYPLGSHEEYYGEHYIKLDFPPDIDMEKMMSERVTAEPKMDYTDNIVKVVKFLEENAHIKDYMREKGTPYILENFNINKIGPKWETFFNKLCLPSLPNPFDFFDKIYYINLDSRIDRKEKMEALFAKYKIKAERFPAITLSTEQNQHLIDDGCIFRNEARPMHSLYTKSCALSHLSVVLRAKLMDYKNVLILEDDVVFAENILEELTKSLEDLKKQEKWDMFYIGCNPLRYKKITNNLGKSISSLTAHSYAVNKHFYDTILNISFKHIPCIDMFYESLSASNNMYMALKNLAWQGVGYSTLEEMEVDYLPSIQARYDHNLQEDDN